MDAAGTDTRAGVTDAHITAATLVDMSADIALADIMAAQRFTAAASTAADADSQATRQGRLAIASRFSFADQALYPRSRILC